MKAIAIIVGTLAVLNIANAQWPSSMRVIGSDTGQFFVSARGPLSAHSLELAVDPGMITLDPALLTVSCERIKRQLLHDLDARDHWRGKIFVILRPARTADDPISVDSALMGDHWDCRVELPDAIDRNRLVEAIVRACLQEMANRNATTRAAELPEWLVRGFARQLMGSSEIKLILPPPTTKVNGLSVTRTTVDFSDAPRAITGEATRKLNPLAASIQILHTNSPLTFDQLSWPTDEELSDNGVDLYGSCAQVFLSQLLTLKNGPQSLQNMLAEMPGYLNWQLAFLDAFHASFGTALDVEKWWALDLAQFTGRDLLHLLTPEESARELDAVFQFPIEVRIGVAPPMRTDISFQTIIRGWSRPQQLPLIKSKIWELEVLRLRISPEYISLLDGYREALQTYYNKRNASARLFSISRFLPDKSVDEAIQKLNLLDVKRANMRHQLETPAAPAPQTTASR